MAIPLLKTKLYVPVPRPELVPRPRLVERISAGIHSGCKLTLISAPAGFGKTTLVSDWIRQANRPAAWFSLDEGDNDPVRFWAYVTAALQTIPGLNEAGAASLAALQAFRTQQPASVSTPRNGAGQIESLLTGLINELAECSDPLVLVLDDLHAITWEQTYSTLLFLLRGLPPHVHLIVSTRTDPPWPLARLRVRGEIAELRAKDLRFTLDEAVAFLNDVKNLDLSVEDITALDARTEGWIAGLQMAALALQGMLSTQEQTDRTTFIERLGGTHHFILDYLVEEVLDRQTDDIRDFMLKTSILKRLTAPLCDVLTGMGDSQAVLIRLEQANLFLTSLDDERRWYRYHPLFADLLCNRLSSTWSDQIPTLHRQASEWCEQNDLVADAISYALAADDVGRAADLMAENALAMVYQGELTTVLGWLKALPEEIVRSRPWLRIAYAWAMVYTGQLDAVEAVLRDIQASLTGLMQVQGQTQVSKPSAIETARIKGHCAAIRAYAAFLEWDRTHGIEFAREALVHLDENDLAVRGLVAMVLALGLYGSGDLEAAGRMFTEAIEASKATNDRYIAINALCELADLQITLGQLHQAAATCREALQMANVSQQRGKGQLPIAGYAYGRMSVVLREWNRLADAIHHAQRGVELCRHWGQADALILGHSFLAGALAAAGNVDGALAAIQEAKRIASDVSPRYGAFVAAKEARLRIAMGDLTGAIRWAQESGLSFDDESCRPVARYIILARVLIACALSGVGADLRRPDTISVDSRAVEEKPTSRQMLVDALALLARLLSMAEGAGAKGHAIELLALQSIVLQAQGKPDCALAALERALSLAEPEGYVRSFIDQGEPMGPLLRQAAARGIAVDYVRTLLDVLERETAASEIPPAVHPALIEPLTERELEVLRLLVVGLSNKAIAGTLVIAEGTVKQHLKHIYGKLEVHNRTEAARRAGELGLV